MEYVFASVGYFLYFYPTKHRRSTLNDGYVVIPPSNLFSVLSMLPDDYVFVDYLYIIQGTALPTFHRDVTSGQRYCGTKYPTYTAIQYHFDGDFLAVCPNSHKHYPFVLSSPHTISGKKSTIVLFNADLLHAGMPNTVGDRRVAHQYKLVHKEDLQYMSHLQGVSMTKKERPLNPLLTWILRQCSFHGAFFVSVFLPSCLQKRHTTGLYSYLQHLSPLSFYNN